MSGFKPLDLIERSQYLTAFSAWVAARAGGRSESLMKGMEAVSVSYRTYCCASLEVLFHELSLDSRRSRQVPKFPPGFDRTLADHKAGKIHYEMPQAFRATSEEYMLTDTVRRETCGKCEGEGRERCPSCEAKGRLKCGDCGGDGLCTHCKGAKTQPCPKCEGKPSVPCPVCVGKGWVRKDFETVRCPNCMNGLIVCDECGGRGRRDCTECFGKGTCVACRGIGSIACVKCGGQGTPMCTACGGEGQWHTYTVLMRNVSRRDARSFDALDVLPKAVTAKVSAHLDTSTPIFEQTFGPGEIPNIDYVDVGVAEFVARIWKSLFNEVGTTERDIYCRFSTKYVPVARLDFDFAGKHFTGYFVGPAKDFFCDADPVEYMLDITLKKATDLLASGDRRAAVETSFVALSEAVANRKYRPLYREMLNRAASQAHRDFAGSSFPIAVVTALVFSSVHLFTRQFAGLPAFLIAAACATFAGAIAPLVGSLLGVKLVFRNARLAGWFISSGAAALAASSTWLVSKPALMIPVALGVIVLCGLAAFVILSRRPTALGETETNLITLCLRDSDPAE
ncbi:MAG: hypothetical protein WC712_01355 [Candidatus Brocadiia bacterium]